MNKHSLVLVTGAAGMVGRALTRKLDELGFTHVLIPPSTRLDLRDGDNVDRFFRHNPVDYVFHLAGRVGGISANMAAPYAFLLDNLLMACNLIDVARHHGVKRFVNFGSSCMYPRACPQPMVEDALLTGALEPTNEGYALAKLCAQRLCQYAGANFVTLVPCNLYGPHDHFGTDTAHVIPTLIARFVEARDKAESAVVVWGTGQTRREFLYVDDAVEALLYFAELANPPSPVNIGLGADVTIAELANLIASTVGFKGQILYDATKPAGMPRKVVDTSRAVFAGWNATTSLKEGLNRTVEWYECHRKR